MQRRTLACLLAAIFIVSAAAAADDGGGKLTLQEIGKLRLAKTTNAEIIEMIKERGVAFEVDKDAEGRLRSMLFKPAEIELIAKIADGRYQAELKKAEEEKAKFEAERPKAPKAGTAPQGVNVGPRITDGAHDTIAARIKRIWAAANINAKYFPTETVTVICSEKSAQVHVPDVKKIEEEVRKRFGEPIKTGTDKRSAYIVLCDTRYDYESWIKAMFEVYKKDGITFTGEDPLAMALKGPAFLTPTMTVVDLSALTPEQQRHNPVFCFGYLYQEQLTEKHSPDAGVCGFSNLCETIIFGSPMIRLNSYAMREIGGQAEEWAGVVRRLLDENKLAPIARIVGFYTTASMEPQQYCEAWSLISFLAASPELYNRWLVALRDNRDEKPMQSLLRIYGKTEAELTKAWHASIKGDQGGRRGRR